MKIEIEDLSCRIGKKLLLSHVSMSFEGRRIVGVIGPNGCGKTTLLRHIYRDIPVRGHVFLDGKDVSDYGRRIFAQKVAVMAQRLSQADEGLTVGDLVRMGRYPYKGILEQYDEEDERIVREALEQTGLSEFKNRRLGTMSGGEAQRAMIAKCFVQQPGAIILDEPTNHLDVKYKLELMRLLKGFGGLVILTVHDLNLAADYCDYLYVMKDGEVRGEGEPEAVLTEALLGEVFEVPFRAVRSGGRVILSV
ncbi:MAG: ABC transporter ATP-binding protein [Eubacteriales bacterium]|nr:ABC transporter ATP-binding protein [Eubacteriales bacterium]